jgi:hypothetical protein
MEGAIFSKFEVLKIHRRSIGYVASPLEGSETEQFVPPNLLRDCADEGKFVGEFGPPRGRGRFG